MTYVVDYASIGDMEDHQFNLKTYRYPDRLPEGGKPSKIVVLLHGLGANGQDLLGLAPHWGASVAAGTLFLSPDAPFSCDMAPGMAGMYQWFSLQDRDPDKILSGVQTAQLILDDYLDQVLAHYGVADKDLALVGFSQGTMMSLYTAPRRQHKIAGVLGYSGALIGAEGLSAADIQKPPICLIHGESDDVVPFEAYETARRTVIGQGFDVSGMSIPGLSHGIDDSGVVAGNTFLADILG